jgi:hypothetical protein
MKNEAFVKALESTTFSMMTQHKTHKHYKQIKMEIIYKSNLDAKQSKDAWVG